MIKFNKPNNLNGKELLDELTAAGISVNSRLLDDGNNELWLDISELDEAQAKTIVAAHNGTIIAPEPTIQEKLANAGITLDELKVALGL